MALARVQVTPKGAGNPVTTIGCTFSTPPTVGNGVILLITAYNGFTVTSVTDNRSNTYTLARTEVNSGQIASVYYCPILTGTGSPFTVTANFSGTGGPTIAAIEVSGVGTGLSVDKTSGATGGSATPNTGATTALTASEVFLVATLQTAAGHTTIVVDVATPVWTQEYESIPFSNPSGEANSRILTSAAGTTQSCGWTTASANSWAAVLVAFKGAVAATESEKSYAYIDGIWEIE